jgi:hypothetical protein
MPILGFRHTSPLRSPRPIALDADIALLCLIASPASREGNVPRLHGALSDVASKHRPYRRRPSHSFTPHVVIAGSRTNPNVPG